MTLVRTCYRRWRAGRAATQQLHLQEQTLRSHLVLGAYGLDFYPQPEPSTLNDSLLVSWMTAEKQSTQLTAR